MIVGPVLLALAIGLLGSAERSTLAQWLNAFPPLKVTLDVLARIVPYAIVTLVFTGMYVLIPNTRVRPQAALIGGVTAGIIWALVGRVFTDVIVYSSQMVAVYTGFAIVLTTLIWVYLSWLILLIGAQLAFYVQFPQYLRHGQVPVELTGSAREQAGLSLMVLIGRTYIDGRNYWTGSALAAELDIPSTALAPVLASLERSGLVVATEKEQFVPGRDLLAIRLIDVIEAVRIRQPGRLTIDMHPVPAAANVMSEVEAAIAAGLGARTLKDLIAAGTPP
jgi:membrane protein